MFVSVRLQMGCFEQAAVESFGFGGYYEAPLVPSLRVVALNTETCHVRYG